MPGDLAFNTSAPELIHPDAQLGIGVSSAGDYDADGRADSIVGGNQMGDSAVPGSIRPGAASVLPGRSLIEITLGVFVGDRLAEGLPPTWPQFTLYGTSGKLEWLGIDVAGLGDINGDGFSDVAVGAGRADGPSAEAGRVHIALGGRGQPGRFARAEQAGSVTAQRVPRLGRAEQADRFRVRMIATHPAGRGVVQLEVETCPASVAFGHASCIRTSSGNWLEPVPAGTDLGVDVTGLAPDTLYRWRARILHGPLSLLEPGITSPPLPGHGPWRRLHAQVIDAEIRTTPPLPDGDADSVPDNLDNCPFHATLSVLDKDGDGRGDACECTDQNGDGRNTVTDIVAINAAIFNPSLAKPLCDGNGDGLCNVSDIIAANVEIFSPTSTSTCARYPVPGP
jgi:hypothetical protein